MLPVNSMIAQLHKHGYYITVTIYVGAGKFCGAMELCPNFRKLSGKVFARLLPTNFLPQRT